MCSLQRKTWELEAISGKVMLSGSCVIRATTVVQRSGFLRIVSVTDIMNSTFADRQTRSLVDWSLNPVSMLHYDADFSYFATHLLQSMKVLTLLTEVPIWMAIMDKAILDLIMTKSVSCHGKDVWTYNSESNREEFLCQDLIDHWMFSGLP